MKLPTELDLLQQLTADACRTLEDHARKQRRQELIRSCLVSLIIVSILVWVCT